MQAHESEGNNRNLPTKSGDATARLVVAYNNTAARHTWQIKEATGMTNVSDMVNNFLQAEEKNFSLFNFVNELNRCVACMPARVMAHVRGSEPIR